jgi:hypothetical protein
MSDAPKPVSVVKTHYDNGDNANAIDVANEFIKTSEPERQKVLYWKGAANLANADKCVDNQKRLDFMVQAAKDFAAACNCLTGPPNHKDLQCVYKTLHFFVEERVTPPCCLLCLQVRNVVKSHVWPEFVLRQLTNGGSTSFTLIKNKKVSYMQSAKSVAWPMFCLDCEALFSEFENYVSKRAVNLATCMCELVFFDQ